jgi:hypothetical protein
MRQWSSGGFPAGRRILADATSTATPWFRALLDKAAHRGRHSSAVGDLVEKEADSLATLRYIMELSARPHGVRPVRQTATIWLWTCLRRRGAGPTSTGFTSACVRSCPLVCRWRPRPHPVEGPGYCTRLRKAAGVLPPELASCGPSHHFGDRALCLCPRRGALLRGHGDWTPGVHEERRLLEPG